MLYMAIIAIVAGLSALGAVLYRAGRKAAENEGLKVKDKENEQVDKIIRTNANLGRNECLKRLRDGSDK